MVLEEMSCLKAELMQMFSNKNFSLKLYTFKEILERLNNRYPKGIVREALDQLVSDGQIIYNDKKCRYQLLSPKIGYAAGIIRINKYNEGYVTGPNGDKYKIPTDLLNGALDGDKVLVKIISKSGKNLRLGQVDKILKRKDGLVVVEVVDLGGGNYELKPYTAVLDHPIILNCAERKVLVDGDRLEVRINDLTDDNCYHAEFVASAGHKNDPDSDLKVIALEHGIPIDFSEESLMEANQLPTFVSDEEKEGRLDLTEDIVFTIDGEKTKDRDDAISISILDNGNYLLGVHIADVTHYVHPGMKLWDEALKRGTSVYMSDTVIPMLPHIISNGICSLNPGDERLTVSCMMEIDKNGNVLNFDFVDSVIKSRKAMTYEDINAMFLDGKDIIPGYEEFYDELCMLGDLTAKLEKKKEKRGCMNLGCNDIEITKDKEGNPIEFSTRSQRLGEKMIENAMLLTGENYANYVVYPTPLRVHEGPDLDKVNEAYSIIRQSAVKVKTIQNIVNPKTIQNILDMIEEEDLRNVIANIYLRAMNRARYDVEELGHFGLSLDKYGHFTSPIRRSADLVGHLMLKQQRSGYVIQDVEALNEEISKLCKHFSDKERSADEAEREANSLEMAKYMEKHIGEEFPVRITYMTDRFIYVKTTNGIAGKLDPHDISGDRFTFDESRNSWHGKKTRTSLKIGTFLVLSVSTVNTTFKSISFQGDAKDFTVKRLKKVM